MRIRGLGGAAVAMMLAASTAKADCAAPLSDFQAHGAAIGVFADAALPPGTVAEAIAIWQGCANYGRSFPELLDELPGSRNVTIAYDTRRTGVNRLCGTFIGGRIQLYATWTDESGQTHSCGSLAQNLAHELGHVLGLQDAPVADDTCRDNVMAAVAADGGAARRPTAQECQLVGQKWLTPGEEEVAHALGDPEPYLFAKAKLR